MIAQVAGDFLDGHVIESGLVEDFAGGFRARHARIHLDLAVFAVGVGQLYLCSDAEQQAGNEKAPIKRIKQIPEHHKFKSFDSVRLLLFNQPVSCHGKKVGKSSKFEWGRGLFCATATHSEGEWHS
jgi:hypothetical protein